MPDEKNTFLSLHFVPTLQSVVYISYQVYILYPVCTLRSAVCSLHFVLTGIRGTNTVFFCYSYSHITHNLPQNT